VLTRRWRSEGNTSQSFQDAYKQARSNLLSKADANAIILQMRTWQEHGRGSESAFLTTSIHKFLDSLPTQ
jgi:hypothetical protein